MDRALFVAYFKRILTLWSGRLLVIVDLIGVLVIIVSVSVPSVSLPSWTIVGFLLVTVIALLFANMQLYQEHQTMMSELQNQINEQKSGYIDDGSFVVVHDPILGSRKALVKYIRGKESVREIEAVVSFYRPDGKLEQKVIDTFYDSRQRPERPVAHFLEPLGEFSFYLPSSDETADNKVTVKIRCVGAQSTRVVLVEERFEVTRRDLMFLL